MKHLKLVCGIILLAIAASNFWTMSRWSERRGVADDLCYLRQAHLFQKNGLRGFETDIRTETDGYYQRLVTEIGKPDWHTAEASVCHIDMTNTGKRVLQYPPGVGAVLSLFPEGRQVIPLYYAATIATLLIGFGLISLARSSAAIAGATAFGGLALYFMVNPAKASYSIPPTMVLCALVGYLTAKLFERNEQKTQWLVAGAIGVLLGLAVNFRIPNLLLCAGYGIFFLAAFVARRDISTFLRGTLFGIGCVIGMAPTLIANAVNAGSPFATTYGGQDLSPPDFTFSITRAYLGDLQGALIIAALLGAAALLVAKRSRWLLPVAAIVVINLAVNLGYFLSHPIFTQYYLVPLAMLSLWSLVFGSVMEDRRRHPAAS